MGSTDPQRSDAWDVIDIHVHLAHATRANRSGDLAMGESVTDQLELPGSEAVVSYSFVSARKQRGFYSARLRGIGPLSRATLP